MELKERTRSSVGWKELPSRTGKMPDEVLLQALDYLESLAAHELAVFECETRIDSETNESVETRAIDVRTLEQILPKLEILVKGEPEQTAAALRRACGDTADLARVLSALVTATWPDDGNDPAEEAAAFTHYLFAYGRLASALRLGICWELRAPRT